MGSLTQAQALMAKMSPVKFRAIHSHKGEASPESKMRRKRKAHLLVSS